MKKNTLIVLTLFSFLAASKAIAQQGFGTNQPDRSAAVDIVSSKRGLLIPRLALTSTTVAAPVNSPAESLLVYNTATAGDVTPGYYYWDGAWVRFVSTTTEKTVTVSAGENITVSSSTTGNTTDYEVAVAGGTDGQVLVTRVVAGVTSTVWVDPATFINGVVTASNGLNINASNDVKLGGTLTGATEITTDNTNTLAISGLENVSATFDSTTQNIVVMGADGVLKLTSAQSLVNDAIDEGNLTAKTLSGNGITVTAGNTVGTDVSVASSLLKDVTLGIADNAITTDKILDQTIGTVDLADDAVTSDKVGADAITSVKILDGEVKATDLGADAADEGKVGVVQSDGTIVYQNISSGNVDGENLTVSNGIEFRSATNGVNALLTATDIGIADGGVTNVKIADGSVSADKMTSFTTTNGTADPAASGTVPVADGSGNVTYQNVSTAIGNDLTTDGIIVIGTAENSVLADAVLVPTALKIKNESITTTQILNGTIATEDFADDAVTNAKIATETITSGKILNGTILNEDLSDKQITAAKLNADGITEGFVPTVNADGTVTYKEISATLGKTLSTDGKIVIGSANASNLANAVLVDTELKIAEGSITTTEIADGTIAAADMADAGNDQVLVTSSTGEATWINQTALPNTTTADNGLTKTGNNVQLGGALITPTVITADATNTLAIAGLQNSAANSAAIVLADETGVLRKVARSLEFSVNATTDVATQTGYNKFVQEITILVTIGASDLNINLPAATDATGQVINVKIANTSEPDAYVNIPGVDGVTIYGSMPYQGWIIKSNGTTWSLVGRI